MYSNQRGNILFLILLAVVLFAALSYAVTQSTRGGGNSASVEKLQTQAAAILNTATLMENTVQRVKMTNNCSDTQLNFAHATGDGYTNASAPATGECNIFGPSGGGMAWPALPAEVNNGSDWAVTGNNNMYGLIDLAPCCDLMLMLPYITKDLCLVINQRMGIPNIPQDVAQIRFDKFTGTYNSPGHGLENLSGQRTACFEGGGSPVAGTYHFAHVLIAR